MNHPTVNRLLPSVTTIHVSASPEPFDPVGDVLAVEVRTRFSPEPQRMVQYRGTRYTVPQAKDLMQRLREAIEAAEKHDQR